MALKITWKKTVCYENPDNREDVMLSDKIYQDAYASVGRYDGNKHSVNFAVNIYTDSTKSELIETYLYKMQHSVLDNAENVVKQAYMHLKTLPEFTDAVDC